MIQGMLLLISLDVMELTALCCLYSVDEQYSLLEKVSTQILDFSELLLNIAGTV